MKWFFKLPRKQAAILALIFCNIIWGAASPIFKWSLQDIPLFVLAYFRFFIASILLFPIASRNSLIIHRQDWGKILGFALSGVTFNITFFFLGLKLAPSINAPIIASAGPIFLLLASIIFLKENPKRKKIIGMLISLLGVFVIIGRPLIENGFAISGMLGNIFILMATFGAVGHTIFCKQLSHKYPANTITFWAFIIGTVTFLPFFINESLSTPWIINLDIRGYVGLVFGSVLSSFIAYSLYSWAIARIDASEAGIFTYIDPVAATIIAIPLLGEIPTPLFILGTLFVFGGIFVAEGRLHYHPFHRLRYEPDSINP
ncbi:MAG: hypothetical protein UR52_C0008G0048 [Candidatus Gottesmanbacteria bacterium GW2011_GWA1_34_13]|uniref:EamA domain-containing protein n=1 Tax=Candidatus Gottesmanbacteria bacterium GW2011_GWA1_34_13 TaxID=1618434 RepID=A0A0G0AQS2_9BACT|nr:MAG: hypothetical protein UR52_C0008G0048 [Candidatus Gottesmanbacteria bacterium GW2011_GWA1_34_13]